MTTEKIKVSPLTGTVLSHILRACTYEYANKYTAIMKDRYSATVVSMSVKSPFRMRSTHVYGEYTFIRTCRD